MIKIGIIGMGYWGPNLLRNFNSNKKFKIKYICDINKQNLNIFSNFDNDITTTKNYHDIINDKTIDAVVIATPVKTHFKIAYDALTNKKHVFVEKPLSENSLNCKKLINLAKKNKLSLFVDHTFLYTEAVIKLREISRKKDFGKIMYYDSTRINLGLIQNDINVLWDLAVHDLAILNYISDDIPVLVSSVGHKHFKSKPITSAYMTIKYDTNFIAHINVNWLSPVKVRQTIVAGTKKMILYNDLEPSDKLSVFNKGVDIIKDNNSSKNLVNYKVGDTYIPNLKNKEALSLAVSEFYQSIVNMKPAITDGNNGLDVVKILEAADKSMKLNGKPIRLSL